MIRREQHTRHDVHAFSCAASPLFGPAGDVIGAVDVTGGDIAADRHILGIVRATAAAMQRELELMTPPSADHAPAPAGAVRLRLLSTVRPQLEIGDRAHPLTARRAELLTVLATTDGITADELLDRCCPASRSSSAARVEMLRLRRWLEEIPGAPPPSSRGRTG